MILQGMRTLYYAILFSQPNVFTSYNDMILQAWGHLLRYPYSQPNILTSYKYIILQAWGHLLRYPFLSTYCFYVI